MGFFECKMLSHDLSDSSDYLAKEDEFYFYQSDAEDLEVKATSTNIWKNPKSILLLGEQCWIYKQFFWGKWKFRKHFFKQLCNLEKKKI